MPKLTSEGVNLVPNYLERSDRGLHVFFNICKQWGLTSEQEQILLGKAGNTFANWKSGLVEEPLEPTTLQRLSHIFRIYGALEILLPVPERAAVWVKAPNTAPLFDGATALDRMLMGNVADLQVVADYLDLTIDGE